MAMVFEPEKGGPMVAEPSGPSAWLTSIVTADDAEIAPADQNSSESVRLTSAVSSFLSLTVRAAKPPAGPDALTCSWSRPTRSLVVWHPTVTVNAGFLALSAPTMLR